MTKTFYVISVETPDGVRYVGDGFALVKARMDAIEYADIESAMRRQNHLSLIWPNRSFGVLSAERELDAFRRENGF